jgi:CRP-like cAMP-binding protein
MAQMSRRLHFQLKEIDRLTLHNATQRVVYYILEHVSESSPNIPEFNLDIPKHLLASRLSITPETLSRTFSKLSQSKLIEINENNIILKNLTGLKALYR